MYYIVLQQNVVDKNSYLKQLLFMNLLHKQREKSNEIAPYSTRVRLVTLLMQRKCGRSLFAWVCVGMYVYVCVFF